MELLLVTRPRVPGRPPRPRTRPVVFQLLNQFENTGPPPADKEKIQALPTVPVTEEHVGGCLAPGDGVILRGRFPSRASGGGS